MIDGHASHLLSPLEISHSAKSRLETFTELLGKWNRSINLVSDTSLTDVWNRHILDSAQLTAFLDEGVSTWADFGSGGGFPGVVVAAISADRFPKVLFTLVESDQRKAAFLATVSRETGIRYQVLNARIEEVKPLQADIVSARALAPLERLCSIASPHLQPNGKAVFLKGAKAMEEVSAARESWKFDLVVHPSISGAMGSILEVSNLAHV